MTLVAPEDRNLEVLHQLACGGRHAATRLFQPRPKRFSTGRGPAKPAPDHTQQFRVKGVHPPFVAAEQPLPSLHIVAAAISVEERLKTRRPHQPITQQKRRQIAHRPTTPRAQKTGDQDPHRRPDFRCPPPPVAPVPSKSMAKPALRTHRFGHDLPVRFTRNILLHSQLAWVDPLHLGPAYQATRPPTQSWPNSPRIPLIYRDNPRTSRITTRRNLTNQASSFR